MHGIFKEVGKIDANLNNFKKECFIKICKAKEKRKNKMTINIRIFLRMCLSQKYYLVILK